CRNASIVERPRINRAVADFVDGVIPRLQEECRRCLLGDVYARIEGSAGATQMTRIDRDSKVRATAQLVSRIDWLVGGREDIAGLRTQIAACREADHPYFVGI